MTTTSIIERVKSADQDFEFYPTSQRMLELVAKDLHLEFFDNSFSILDIGAGNGNALKVLCDLTSQVPEINHTKKQNTLFD